MAWEHIKQKLIQLEQARRDDRDFYEMLEQPAPSFEPDIEAFIDQALSSTHEYAQKTLAPFLRELSVWLMREATNPHSLQEQRQNGHPPFESFLIKLTESLSIQLILTYLDPTRRAKFLDDRDSEVLCIYYNKKHWYIRDKHPELTIDDGNCMYYALAQWCYCLANQKTIEELEPFTHPDTIGAATLHPVDLTYWLGIGLVTVGFTTAITFAILPSIPVLAQTLALGLIQIGLISSISQVASHSLLLTTASVIGMTLGFAISSVGAFCLYNSAESSPKSGATPRL